MSPGQGGALASESSGGRSAIKVVYIAGHNRSGSTLLDRMLGQIEGFISVGELRQLWWRGLEENQACGCGVPFHDCRFWADVIRTAYGTLEGGRLRDVIHLARQVASVRTVPQLAWPWLRTVQYSSHFREFGNTLRHLYQAIHAAGDGAIIVDSSKSPSYGLLLAQLPFLEVHVVHLVRDSRAVAYSQQRPKLKPEIHWEEQRMKVTRPTSTAVIWFLTNAMLHLLDDHPHYMRVRYEDFVANPQETLRRIAGDCGRADVSLPFLRERSVLLGEAHTVSGNPIRFQQGWTSLTPDLEWRDKLATSDRRIISAVTAPLLAKYGYF